MSNHCLGSSSRRPDLRVLVVTRHLIGHRLEDIPPGLALFDGREVGGKRGLLITSDIEFLVEVQRGVTGQVHGSRIATTQRHFGGFRVELEKFVGPRLQILLVDEFGGFLDAFRQADFRVSIVSLPILLRWLHPDAVYLDEQRLEVFDIARLTDTYMDRVPVSPPPRQPATTLITGTVPTALRNDRPLMSTIRVTEDKNAGVPWRWCVRVLIIGVSNLSQNYYRVGSYSDSVFNSTWPAP